jgi:uncharacterized protein YdhG (YjbR/CyaY superfamily)
MYQDYKDLWSAFHAHGVRYLIVGGYAVIFHAQPRFTKHIGLFIKADLANAQATWAALASFGAPLEGIRPEEFAERSNFLRFGRDPRGFDIRPDLPGVDFDAAWGRRVEGVLDTKTGLTAFFIFEGRSYRRQARIGKASGFSGRRGDREGRRKLEPTKRPATGPGNETGRAWSVTPVACVNAGIATAAKEINMATGPATPKNVDEYIAAFYPDVQAILKRIRLTIHNVAPDAQETISYRIPTFTQHGVLVYFAAFRNHIGLYPPVSGDARLEKAIAPYAGAKGNLRFPLNQPIPYDLIERIVKLRAKQNLAKAAAKSGKRRS